METNNIDVVKAFEVAITKRNPSEMSSLMTERLSKKTLSHVISCVSYIL